MKCLRCKSVIVPKLRADIKRLKFCSSTCQVLFWHETHKDRLKIITKKSRSKRSNKIQEYNLKYYYSHKERQLENQRTRYHRDPSIEIQRVINRRIRLKSLGFHSLDEWNNLKLKHNFKCLHCKRQEPEIKLTRDHIVPISRGGSNYISNIQPLSRSCNSRKFNHL